MEIFVMGNAIVDKIAYISEDLLASKELKLRNIKKGTMNLLQSKEELESTISTLQKKNISTVKRAGGASANTAWALRYLGHSSSYNFQVANDEDGHFFFAEMQGANIYCLGAPAGNQEAKTGSCLVLNTPDNQRTLLSYLGIAPFIEYNAKELDKFTELKLCYLEGYLWGNDYSRDLAIKSIQTLQKKNKQLKIALNLSDVSIVEAHRNSIRDFICSHPTILFCNIEEAFSFTQKKNIMESGKVLSDLAPTVYISCGEKGAYCFWRDDKIKNFAYAPLLL